MSSRALIVVSLALGGLAHAQGASAPPTAPAAAAAPAPAAAAVPGPAAAADAGSGRIAWYGGSFAGRRTASGEPFDPAAMTMAHRTLPFGTRVKVTNPANKQSVTLRVNDRGPTQNDRVGDVSLAAARQLGMVRAGVIDAELEVVGAAAAKKQ